MYMKGHGKPLSRLDSLPEMWKIFSVVAENNTALFDI